MGMCGFKEGALLAGCTLFGAATLLGQLIVAPVTQLHSHADRLVLSRSIVPPPPKIAASLIEEVRPEVPSIPQEPVEPGLSLSRVAEALVQIESAGDANCVGNHGERGLMQLKSSTWESITMRLYGRPVSFRRAFEPGLNRSMGLAYLGELREFLAAHRDEWNAPERELLMACYNCGPARVLAADFDLAGLPEQTRDYIERACAICDDLEIAGVSPSSQQ